MRAARSPCVRCRGASDSARITSDGHDAYEEARERTSTEERRCREGAKVQKWALDPPSTDDGLMVAARAMFLALGFGVSRMLAGGLAFVADRPPSDHE